MKENELFAWQHHFLRVANEYDPARNDSVEIFNLIARVEALITEDLRPRIKWPNGRQHGSPGQRYHDLVRGYRCAVSGILWQRQVDSWKHLSLGICAGIAQVLADMTLEERLALYQLSWDYLPEAVRELQNQMEVTWTI
jgi:hypothetical protein